MSLLLKAECTWGEGPDVLVSIHKPQFLLAPVSPGWSVHGHVTRAQLDLTTQEAKDLAQQLLAAADRAEELDRECADVLGTPAHDDE